VDGVFGRKTRKAIKAYQKNEGQVVTGYLDKGAVKKLTQMGKVASKNAKKKTVAKAKINTKPVKIEKKKNSENESQTKANNHIQPKKNLTAFNQKEKKPENEIKIDLKKETEKQEYDKAEVSKQFNDGIIKTTDELEKRYKSLIDSFNQSMNDSFGTQMINAIESCNRTGYYVSGAFISHYMYLRLNDLASMSQTESDFHQKTKLAKHFKNTRNQMIMYYNGSAGNKEALMAVLNKCEEYYQNTDTRSVFRKK
jgi:peptidoglycan hydrolase-like protein with peptidoglycan-binding domain